MQSRRSLHPSRKDPSEKRLACTRTCGILSDYHGVFFACNTLHIDNKLANSLRKERGHSFVARDGDAVDLEQAVVHTRSRQLHEAARRESFDPGRGLAVVVVTKRTPPFSSHDVLLMRSRTASAIVDGVVPTVMVTDFITRREEEKEEEEQAQEKSDDEKRGTEKRES